ncbi:MAG: OmpA family protein [Bacteroidota bacterium]
MKKIVLVCFVICFYSLYTYGQRGDCNDIKNAEALGWYNEAITKPEYKQKEAQNLLEKAILAEPDFPDAYYKLAEIYYQQAIKIPYDTNHIKRVESYYTTAEQYFLKVIELCPSFNYYSAYYYLGDFYYSTKDFEKSGFYLHTFLDYNEESKVFVDKAHKMIRNVDYYLDLINNPVPFDPSPLFDVCTANDEYLPLISPDEELLIFSRRILLFPNTAHEKSEEKLELSVRLWEDSSGFVFSKGNPMREPFNDGRNQGGATITIDNNHIFITICEYERANHTSYKNCDIFTSDRVDGKWMPLKRMNSRINSPGTFEGMPSITADGKILFFASVREGGYGGLDIYKSEKEENGNWGKAQNLGPVINTEGDEKTPFIHSDSQTLYFSTNGIFGLGGYDIFYSQYRGQGQWSESKNMGFPINTGNDEVGLIVSANGKKIFFSSRTLNEDKNWDIYSAGLYEKARPQKVLFVKGKLYDEKGDKVTKARVELKSIQTEELTEGMVDEHSGNYAVAVPVKKGEEFIMTAKKKGYFFNSVHIDPQKKKFDPPTTVDFKIEKMEKGKPVILNNVNFATGSHELNIVSKAELNRLVEFLKENNDLKIYLYGHTDNMGSTDYNVQLSLRRTKSVKKYLRSKGINPGRVSYKGFGEKRPIASNKTSYGRSLNRRVEFMLK